MLNTQETGTDECGEHPERRHERSTNCGEDQGLQHSLSFRQPVQKSQKDEMTADGAWLCETEQTEARGQD
ncbi:hypothetical protein GCM10028792_35340 [Salinisphaera aquimarina]